MAKVRSKDPLLAATTSILLPAMKRFGFVHLRKRELARVRDDIVHYIMPWYSGYGGRNFYVDYGAMPLVPPTHFHYAACGSRVWDEVNRRYTWEGQSHELADASMERVVESVQRKVLPFFTSIETTEGFLTEQSSNLDHHGQFRIACCLLRLRRRNEAVEHLNAAIRGYAKDGRDWCPAYAAQCESLLKAIGDGTDASLLESWKLETIHNLKLEKIVSNGPAA
jgi:hypothetical protein